MVRLTDSPVPTRPPSSFNKHDRMEGMQQQLKYPPWDEKHPHLRPHLNARSSPGALPRFTGAAATAKAVAAEECERNLSSRTKLLPFSSQESSRLGNSAFCGHAHPTQQLSPQQQLLNGMLQPTISCSSHESQLFPFLTRYFSSHFYFENNCFPLSTIEVCNASAAAQHNPDRFYASGFILLLHYTR